VDERFAALREGRRCRDDAPTSVVAKLDHR
jgi:hypothetical protein